MQAIIDAGNLSMNFTNIEVPVHFAAKAVSETKLVFENQQHDFPQIISYTRMGSDSLIAEISGIKKGEKEKRTFPMKRLK